MKLTIIDRRDDHAGDLAIEILFEHQQQQKRYQIEAYDSPVYANFQQTLAWYFNQYPLLVNPDESQLQQAQQKVQRLIKFGQSMGDELLGEDFELIAISEQIEQQAYAQLQVELQSRHSDFFTEQWEALVLPESKFMLSCVAQSFSRRFVPLDDSPTFDFQPLQYQLEVTAKTQDDVAKMLQGQEQSTQEPEHKVYKPLKVLKWLSPAVDNSDFMQTNGFNSAIEAGCGDGVIDHELIQLQHLDQLGALLDKQDIHVLHYQGPVLIENGNAYFSFSDQSRLGVSELAEIMVAHRVGALFVEANAYRGDIDLPAHGLAMVAKNAQRHGLGNVVGTSQLTHCWVSGHCFEQLYTQISRGFSLAQAMVETRKALQKHSEIALVSQKPQPFHSWSLLQHYGSQPLQYFISGHQLGDPGQGGGEFYQRLFGFKNQMLPPLLYQTGDGQTIALLTDLTEPRLVNLVGERGLGKTQMAHVLGVYLAQKQQVDHGFYFDFATDPLTPDHIREMIAPVLSLDTNDIHLVDGKLAELNCYFVFDNYQGNSELNQFILDVLQPQKQLILVISNEPVAALDGKVLSQPALTVPEQHMLAKHSLQRLGLLEIESVELLSQLRGNPWLIEKVSPLIAQGQELDLSWLNTQDKVSAFYQWQWQQLPSIWQKLLVLCSEVKGLLLEMLMISIDQQQVSPAVEGLFGLIGKPQQSFSQGIGLWLNGGFVSQYPHGRLVDQRAVDFIAEQKQRCLADLNEQQLEQLQLNFSQLICDGIRMLSTHMLKEPNPNITNNLLANRRYWVSHFERLWFNHDYRGFMGVKQAFDQLLNQAKIGQESHQWACDLLGRSPVVGVDGNMEAQLSWLALAALGVDQPKAKALACFEQGAQQWQQWFTALAEDVAEAQLPLFQQVCSYLECYYRSLQDWSQCLIVVERAQSVYRQYQAWQRVIQSLKSQAVYHIKLEQPQLALAVESQIIHEIDYSDAPPGFKSQQLMEVLFARIGRKDGENAQQLIDLMRSQQDAEQLKQMLDNVQIELDNMLSGDH